jgi:drug/metabolite transporter (DMT)-like permease
MTSAAFARPLSPHARGLLTVGSGGVLLSLDSLLIRLLARSLPTVDVLFWRGVGSALGFAVISFAVSRRAVWGAFRSIGKEGLSVALLYCVGNVMFVSSVTHTTVAHALVIIAAAPVVTAILARIILHERASRRTWLVSIAVAGGVSLIFLTVPSQGDLVGDLAAACGALALSGNLVVLRKAKLVSMIPAFAIGGTSTALFSAPFVTRFSLSPREFALVILVGVVVLPISLSLVARGPRYLQAPDVSLLMLLETVLAPVWAALVLREVPDTPTFVSGAVIVGALAANSLGPWARSGDATRTDLPATETKPETAQASLQQRLMESDVARTVDE